MLPSSSKFGSFIFPTPVQSQSDDEPAADLAALGIKVRDFAYESTLPPIRAYRPRQPIQRADSLSQPARRPLKRTRADGTEVEDLGYGFVMGVARAAPPRKLQRTETGLGPELTAQDEAALRAATWDAFGSSQSQSQTSYYSCSNESSQETDLQDTDLIKTPLITPNGSLHWPDDRSGSPPLVPTEPASLETSTVRLRSPPSPRQKSPTPLPPSAQPIPLARTFSSLSTLSSPLSEAPSSAHGSMVLPPAPAPSPPSRYELRKRVIPPASPTKRRPGDRPTPRREGSLVVIHS